MQLTQSSERAPKLVWGLLTGLGSATGVFPYFAPSLSMTSSLSGIFFETTLAAASTFFPAFTAVLPMVVTMRSAFFGC